MRGFKGLGSIDAHKNWGFPWGKVHLQEVFGEPNVTQFKAGETLPAPLKSRNPSSKPNRFNVALKPSTLPPAHTKHHAFFWVILGWW